MCVKIGFQSVEFLLKTPDLKSVYQGNATLQMCGIRNMAEFLMVPVDENEVFSRLSAVKVEGPRKTVGFDLTGNFIKCGYVILRIQHKRSNTK